MTCIAKWKEGNQRYFVALVSSYQNKWVIQREQYQCFLYEDISNTIKMSQGQFTSSCQGLWSVLEGRRTFSLQKCKCIWYKKYLLAYFLTVKLQKDCILPKFLSSSKRWKSLDHNINLLMDEDQRVFSLLRSDENLEQSVCFSSEYDFSKKIARVLVHTKTGWWVNLV